MNFKGEVLNHYMDREGLVTIDRNPTPWSTGNGLMHTGVFYTILFLRGEIDESDLKRFTSAVDGCWEGPLEAPIAGLLERNNNREDLQAHDDYHVMTASFLLGTYHARMVERYGSSHFWSFNNVTPGKFTLQTWHGRFPGHVGYLRLCADKKPGLFQNFLLDQSIGFNVYSKDATSKILCWLKIQVAKIKGYCKDSIEFWEEKLVDQFGSMEMVFAQYFGHNHPFARCGIKT